MATLARRWLGVAFGRQIPLANYIVDFLAPSVGLIVAVDGPWHQRHIALEERRSKVLTRMGYRVLHLDAALVIREPLVAVDRLREVIATAR